VQFLPEVDTYLKLNSKVRVYFQAKDDREGGDPTQATLGPSIQLYFKPLVEAHVRERGTYLREESGQCAQPSLSGHLNLKLAEAHHRVVCRGSFLLRLLLRDQPRTDRSNNGLRIRRAEGDRATFSRRLGFASLALVSWRDLCFQQNSESGWQLRHLGRTAGREIVPTTTPLSTTQPTRLIMPFHQ
jgi:hypothetical protein